MPQHTRTLWFFSGLGVGLLVTVLIHGYERFKSGGLVLASTRQRVEEGRALGRTLKADACLDMFFVRHVRNARESILEQVNEGVFLESCLK